MAFQSPSGPLPSGQVREHYPKNQPGHCQSDKKICGSEWKPHWLRSGSVARIPDCDIIPTLTQENLVLYKVLAMASTSGHVVKIFIIQLVKFKYIVPDSTGNTFFINQSQERIIFLSGRVFSPRFYPCNQLLKS